MLAKVRRPHHIITDIGRTSGNTDDNSTNEHIDEHCCRLCCCFVFVFFHCFFCCSFSSYFFICCFLYCFIYPYELGSFEAHGLILIFYFFPYSPSLPRFTKMWIGHIFLSKREYVSDRCRPRPAFLLVALFVCFPPRTIRSFWMNVYTERGTRGGGRADTP